MPVDNKGYYTEPVKTVIKLVPQVDDGIPIPEGRPSRNDKGYVAVLRELQVGQSVFLPISRAAVYGRMNAAKAWCTAAGKPAPMFVHRAQARQDGQGGFRVWRSA